MGSLRYTDVIDRASLTKDCLEEVRLWPGCETVHSVAILQDGTDNFLVRVISYGAAKKKQPIEQRCASSVKNGDVII
jgi:hypothetical protein